MVKEATGGTDSHPKMSMLSAGIEGTTEYFHTRPKKCQDRERPVSQQNCLEEELYWSERINRNYRVIDYFSDRVFQEEGDPIDMDNDIAKVLRVVGVRLRGQGRWQEVSLEM